MPSQSDWVISLSRAHALVSCGYNYITISVSILVSRAAPPARKTRVQVVAFTDERQEQLRKYSNIVAKTEKHFFSCVFFFLVSGRTDNTWKRKKERSNKRERENERERKRERKNLRERESPSTKNTWTTKAPLFAEKKNTENFVSQHIKWRAQKRRQSWESYKGKTGTGCVFNCLCGCVFSLFFLSDKRSARKVRERFCSFKRSDSLSEEGVCGSNPKHYKARRIFLSL